MADMGAASAKARVNQNLIIGISTTLLSLCVILYILRLLSRRITKAGLWWDDWWMLAVLGICIFMSTLDFIGVSLGSGTHESTLSPNKKRGFLITLYIFMFTWALGTGVVKIGILLFYWRIFAVRSVRRMILAVGAVVALTHTSLFFAFIFQCIPIHYFWNPSMKGSCFHQDDFYISGGSLNVVGDVTILALPIRTIWALNATRGQKAGLSFLFLLGGFVCVTSVFRLLALRLVDPSDFTWTYVQGGIWSTVEVQVGFICANLPQIRPIFLRLFFPERAKRSGSTQSNGRLWGFRSRRQSSFQADGFQLMRDTKKSKANGAFLASPDATWNNLGVELGTPMHNIKVETNIEQQVDHVASDLEIERANTQFINPTMDTVITNAHAH